MQTLLADSRTIAEDLHSLLKALDRTDAAEVARRAQRIESLADRVQMRDGAADPRVAALVGSVGDVRALARDAPAAASGADPAEFRRRAATAYDALARGLNGVQIRVPALRPHNRARMLSHVGGALGALAALEMLPGHGARIALAAAFLLFAWTVEIGRRRSGSVQRFALGFFGPIVHPSEQRQVHSATWAVTAFFCLALAAPVPAAATGAAVLALADPAAALVGRRFGRVRLRPGRSLEGTSAFLFAGTLAAFAVLAGLHGIPFGLAAGAALAGALAGTLAELFGGPVDDNLLIPITVTAVTGAWLAYPA